MHSMPVGLVLLDTGKDLILCFQQVDPTEATIVIDKSENVESTREKGLGKMVRASSIQPWHGGSQNSTLSDHF